MKNLSNFFLMLKQGIKGVFKFKAQFTIILILSFIATFILSVSLSTQRRMLHSYENVVKKVEKFDYQGNLQADSTANSKSDPFILSNEVDNADTTNIKIYDLDQNGNKSLRQERSRYNYVLFNHYGDEHKNFLNISLSSEKTQELFKTNDTLNNVLMKVYDEVVIPELYSELEQISSGKTPQDSNLLYSAIGQYTVNNPFWFKKENIDNNLVYKMVYNNVNVAVAKIFSLISIMVQDYISDLTNTETYLFLFGIDINNGKDAEKHSQWVVDNESNKAYSLDIDNKDKDKSAFSMISYGGGSSVQNLSEQIIAKGLRGITNPFIDSKPNDINDFNAIGSLDLTTPLQVTRENKDILKALTLTSRFYKDIDYDFKKEPDPMPIEPLFLGDQIISSGAAGFDFKIRREFTFFDSNNQVKFRAISLGENSYEDYNLTIYKGVKPSNQQVLISEQFAKKNHYKVGDSIKVGNAEFMISGIATDALSYMPSQDLLNPIPNPSVSSFIYASDYTIEQIAEETRNAAESQDAVTQNLSYFLWDNQDQKNKANRKDKYLALLFNEQNNSRITFNSIKEFVKNDNKGKFGNYSTNWGVSDFKDSPYRYSWTLQPLVFKFYSAVTYVAAAIIAIIAIVALVVCVRKTISLNSKQIGILKAMGETPLSISVSYISYSLIITFIVVPIAWLVGIFMQIPFSNMFLTYFSAEPNVILFDWISLVIAILGLGILSGIIAFASAYSLTDRSVMEILVSSIKWGRIKFIEFLKNKPFKNAKFSTRFSLTLTSSGSKQIILMTVVIFITSVLITGSLAIPSVAISANDSYYKSVKYANTYNQIDLASNAPLSKNTISFWEGHDALEADYVDAQLELDTTPNRYGYYNNPENYTATIGGSNVLTPYIYADGKLNSTYKYAIENNADLLSIVAGMFGNNFYQDYGESFSVGMVDKFFGMLLHSYSAIDKRANPEVAWSDEDKQEYAKELSSWLTASIPKIISVIVDANGSGSKGEGESGATKTWKEEIMQAIYSAIPSYVKAYVQRSDSRLDQYAISYQNDILVPEKETLTTNVSGNINNKYMKITGLDKYQKSINIDDEEKEAAYLPDDIKQKVFKALDGEWTGGNIDYNGMRLYDQSTNTVTIPVIPNKQAESAYKMKKGKSLSGWSNKVQQIQFKGKDWMNLPQNAWVYDDTSYVKYAKEKKDGNKFVVNEERYTEDFKSGSGKYFLNPYEMDNNKFTLNKQYDENGNLRIRSYAFEDWKYDKDGKIVGAYARPYYLYKDLRLMIPEKEITNEDDFLWGYDISKGQSRSTSSWYKKGVSIKDVPKSVIKGYEQQGMKISDNDTFLVINPYDIAYYSEDVYDTEVPLVNLTQGPAYWYNTSIQGTKPALRMSNDQDRVYGNWNVKVNLKSVGSIESYNEKLVVMDSDFANKMLNYSNARTYQYNYNIFDETKFHAKGEDGSQFDRWEFKNFDDEYNVDDLNKALWMPKSFKYDTSNPLNYAPHRWYNGKLSNVDEALPFTSQISFKGQSAWGMSSIKLGTPAGSLNSIVSGSQLLSESKALIRQVSVLAISIGAMLMVAIIITASLLIMLTGDVYIAQYQRFMVLMRALGYSNIKIISYTFGTVSIMSICAWVLGTVLAWGLIFSGVTIMWNAGFAIPAGISWWPIIVSLLIMGISYIGSLYVSSGKARKENPSILLTATAE